MTELTHTDVSQQAPRWRYLVGGMEIQGRANNYTDAAAFAAAVAQLAVERGLEPEIGLRAHTVHLRLRTPVDGGVHAEHIELAKAVEELAESSRIPLEAGTVSTIEIAIDAVDIPTVKPFWEAILGYKELGSDILGDPNLRMPLVWFQQADETRAERNNVHFDVHLAPEQVQPRIEAALKAGGTLRSDLKGTPGGEVRSAGPDGIGFCVLADPEGNEVCLCINQRGAT